MIINTKDEIYTLKRCVLRRHLNVLSCDVFRMLEGRAFQRLGARKLNVRWPYVAVRGLGCVSVIAWDWRVDRVNVFTVMSCCKYSGAVWYMHLCVSSKILNSMRERTGSQCSSLRSGEVWVRRDFRRVMRDAEFWTFCKRLMAYFGRLA